MYEIVILFSVYIIIYLVTHRRPSEFDCYSLLGLHEAAAKDRIRECGYQPRVVRRDNEFYLHKYQDNVIYLEITNEKVVDAYET